MELEARLRFSSVYMNKMDVVTLAKEILEGKGYCLVRMEEKEKRKDGQWQDVREVARLKEKQGVR